MLSENKKTAPLNLAFGITFHDLYDQAGLVKLDHIFTQYAQLKNADLASRAADSDKLIHTAKIVEEFLAELFNIQTENNALRQKHDDLALIYQIRRHFVQRNIARKIMDVDAINGVEILQELTISFDDIDDLETKLAHKIANKESLELLEKYGVWALHSQEGKRLHKDGALFILPQKMDHQQLIKPNSEKSQRDGFDLTDEGYGLNRALGEAHYCIFCHKQEKDSCRTGLQDRETDQVKINPLGVELNGCPLDEKISEMNMLKSEGFSLAAFAMACVDNPMIAGTGHRICNDCMKSCIFQKQDPVDIPQVETRILKDVLALPYGFEIYSLLTRWNPLKLEKRLPKTDSGKKVLVCGLGPAGYVLAHHLMNDGHEVVGIDGLKIEPLHPEISGIDEDGNRCEFKPIKYVDDIYEPLSKRLIHGFGGVAEYGITVRFDKNFLKVIRLLLERRKQFRMFGGIRFGSSITDKIAFEDYDFDHVALCIGAGRPNVINLKNNLAKGVRMASDFLMSLQLTGAFREDLFTNLQVRMPIAVIGGGLTAVDTACEAQAYYIVQIRKFAAKVEKLGKDRVFATLNAEEKNIAEEFLAHAAELQHGDVSELLQKWGGVHVIYRKKIQESPSYRLNHEELNKAFEEGVKFIENAVPVAVEIDDFGHIRGLTCEDDKFFECKSLMIAAGTTPNISPVLEDGLDLALDGKYFASKSKDSVITKMDKNSGKAVSFFGDLHPTFEGNVVKAMASANEGYQEVSQAMAVLDKKQDAGFLNKINEAFLVRVEKVLNLSENVFEISIKAPLLARSTEIGHIFRLQNYHALAKKVGDQIMAMEAVPITALTIDRDKGIISGIVVNTGGSTSIIGDFKDGQPCIFMGPSGKPTAMPKNETVLLVGGGRGNQPLTAIAEAYQANGCHVIFVAGYRDVKNIVRQERMENACNEMIFAIENESNIDLKVDSSRLYQGNVIDVLRDHLTQNPQNIDRILTIGNDQMMHQVSLLRQNKTVASISNARFAITSLNAPMQCMLKGVCSQCLQKRVNKKGEMEYFYACGDQDQDMDRFDFNHLHHRCEQNSLMEKLSRMWIDEMLNNKG